MKLPASLAAGDDGIVPLLMLLGVAVLIVGHVWWHFSRSRTLLNRWASQQRIRLSGCEYRWLSRGPYFWTTSRNQAVYRIAAEAPDGRTKRGWARVGGWLIGLLSSRVEVRWDEAREGFPVVFPATVEDEDVVRP